MARGRLEQASSHVQWLVIRNNSSFLCKRKLGTFTTEPNNLKNRNSFRLNGLVHPKVVGVESAEKDAGVVFSTGSTKNTRKPAKRFHKVTLKKDSRRTLTSIRRTIRKQRYRKDLKMAALRRASALLRGQRIKAATPAEVVTTSKRAAKGAAATSA